VNGARALSEGSVGVGFSHRVRPDSVFAVLRPLLDAHGMFFNNGAGALMLAYVAAGRLLAYYEPHINAWDCLAGLVLVREAGGWTNEFLDGDGMTRGNPVLAAAAGVADLLRAVTGVV
jgi:myo-inositol-1(or 4)-monophosphatase